MYHILDIICIYCLHQLFQIILYFHFATEESKNFKSIGMPEVVQWIRAFAVLVEDPGLLLRIHIVVHNHL